MNSDEDESENEVPAVDQVVDIELLRAHRFIDHLRENPFVAIVFDKNDGVQVFVRADMTPNHLRQIREALTDLIKEHDG